MDAFYQRVAQARNPHRLFPVRSNPHYDYYAGRLADDEMQALVGRIADQSILFLTFTKDGYLYDIRREDLPKFNAPPEDQFGWVNEQEFHQYLSNAFSFAPALAGVHQFLVSDDDCGFSVGPLPFHFDEFVAKPGEYSPEEPQEFKRLITDFIDRGAAVLDWGNERYVLDGNGNGAK